MKAMIFEKIGITAMVLAVMFASGGHLGGCLLCAACAWGCSRMVERQEKRHD